MEHEGGYYQEYRLTKTESQPDVSIDHPEYARLREQAAADSYKEPMWGDPYVKNFNVSFKELSHLKEVCDKMKDWLREANLKIEKNPGQEIFEEEKKSIEKDLAEKNKEFEAVREKTAFQYNELLDKVEALFNEYRLGVSTDPDGKTTLFLKNELEALFGNFPESKGTSTSEYPIDVDALEHALSKGAVGPTRVLEVFAQHQERMAECQRLAEQKFEVTKKEFITEITKAVAEGWFPEGALYNLRHLETLRITVLDSLENLGDSSKGHYLPNGKIGVTSRIVAGDLSHEFRSTVFHELLHEISGKSVDVETITESAAINSDDLETTERSRMYNNKLGLVKKEAGAESRTGNFLNEAITEWLTLRLTDVPDAVVPGEKYYKGSESYEGERRVLDALFAKGLEKNIVLEAYFENAREGKPGKKWEKLSERIAEIEGDPAGMYRIENQIIRGKIAKKLPKSMVPSDSDMRPFILDLKVPGSEVFTVILNIGEEGKGYVDQYEDVAMIGRKGQVVDSEKRLAQLEKRLTKISTTYPGKIVFKIIRQKT